MNDEARPTSGGMTALKPETVTAVLVLLSAVIMMLAMKLVNPTFGSVE